MIEGRHKVLLTLGCLIPLPMASTLLLVAFAADFDGSPANAVVAALVVLYFAAVAAMIVALIAMVFHITRRADLSPGQRRRWYYSAVFFNVFLLPVAWWKLIRPLGAA